MVKKRVATSYQSLSSELKELFKKTYPTGPEASLIRVDKGNGDFLCGVVLETEDTSYFVKLAVKVDDASNDNDKDYYEEDEDLKNVEEVADDQIDDE
ncbi:MAG: hypothetical protein R3Y04_02150 [Rikenellaceae bacterium]